MDSNHQSGQVFSPVDVRERCRRVTARAESVEIVDAEVDRFADRFVTANWRSPLLDPAHHVVGDSATTWAYTAMLDAINFGSGWFDDMGAVDGKSGYPAVAFALKRWVERCGPPTVEMLRRADAYRVAEILGQSMGSGSIGDWMALVARGFRQLGEWAEGRGDDAGLEGAVKSVAGVAGYRENGGSPSAIALVESLQSMPMFRDVWWYPEVPSREEPSCENGEEAFRVPLLKRAQLFASDLITATFGKWNPEDSSDLTLFSDNMLPAALRALGILTLSEDFAGTIARGDLVRAGSRREIELRASTVIAGERLKRAIAEANDDGSDWSMRSLDYWLWRYGRQADVAAHRTRTPAY